ncbi:diphthamide biosynthesis protein Dph4 [Schizosaccharomyces cryophilus OY26]|uniref:Diphthamide biosynthesis protein 4 n=1 Tax=Schizosaccharomyces cryophilus (strain OY26 / ATCC MYA-4695 / CBS 11777 / NBRC 106824 / NRRL Y48691) TaxID=653667 RepID=S9VUQ3_SCHCR|nr:diphthamide biosynthesis protein Dph4 [Schizosaccharomyces cryophilus OY26]EPY51523.1 diphthamide biosynthesis protein Dph4 [Schizosaccharomyces cryophilus OY26]
MNPYAVLNLEEDELYTDEQVKEAYRKALIQSHPDKRKDILPGRYSVDQIREAFQAIGSTEDRENFLKTKESERAQYYSVVDLSEFDELEDGSYYYPCRCGELGGYVVTEENLENEESIIPCLGCSLTIQVAYEVVETDGSEQ